MAEIAKVILNLVLGIFKAVIGDNEILGAIEDFFASLGVED